MKMLVLFLCMFISQLGRAGSAVDSSAVNKSVAVIPTISAAAYVSGYQVGGVQTLTALADTSDQDVDLISIAIVDKDRQNAPLSFFFFSELPTLISTDHTAFDISDIEMLKCIGFVEVTSYATSASNSVGTASVIFLDLKSTSVFPTGRPTGNIYVVAKTTGTPTYTSTSALSFRYGVVQ